MKFDHILKPIIIEGLEKTINWYQKDLSCYLRSVFNLVGFKDRDINDKPYYVSPHNICSHMNYPLRDNKEYLHKVKKEILLEINKKYSSFGHDYVSELSCQQLLFLLEKFGGNAPFDESEKISIFDYYKIKAAREIIRYNRNNLGHKDNLIIYIDLSGIQKFIYNIVSTGALKNLRSRSFFIELLSHHIIYKTITDFNVHSVNVLMNGGGSIYIILHVLTSITN
jgi:CRISPR-associated protein Csm1